MYIPKHFEESRNRVLLEIARNNPLATLITADSNGLDANHLPLVVEEIGADKYEIFGHVAKNNPLVGRMTTSIDCLVVFHGIQKYISPNWYSTKFETGKAVPTWNYEVVHFYGKLELIDDNKWLRSFLATLVDKQEVTQNKPWKLGDAPGAYLETMLDRIVGIKIIVEKVIGKSKLSQNLGNKDNESLIEALSKQNYPVSEEMIKKIESNR